MLLHNALIVNEGRHFIGYLSISEDGLIETVREGQPTAEMLAEAGDDARDLEGHLLMPGVIDSHVHFREPGGEHKATIASESRAAVAGGVTSFMEMPNTSPATTTLEALEDKFARAGRDSMANYSFWIGATRSNIDVLRAVDYTRVPGVKLFMGSSTGGMLVDGEDALAQVFQLPVLIAAHCEDEAIISQNTRTVKELYKERIEEPPILWHPQIRSALACYKSSARAVELAKRFGSRLHIMHLTTAEELELLMEGDPKITAEVCVAHLLFSDQNYARLGTLIKCNPAVKSAVHRHALRRALSYGLISTVSTDHAPHTLEEKEQPLFKAPSGMPMVQFSLPVMLDLSMQGEWPLELVVQKMCHSQADIFSVEKRGYLRPGYHADLVEVDLDGVTQITPETILSKCGWSPLMGTALRSRVLTTWVNGRIAYTAAAGPAPASAAQPLRFTR